jgi:hypothetical protein
MGKKGGSPPPAPASTQVVRSEIPEFFRPFLEDIFRRSSAISEEAYIPPPERARLQEVGEETLAPIDPAQQAALDRLKSTEMAETGVSAVRAGQGLTLSGAERIGGEQIREAMNPFQQAVTDIAVREELRRAAPQRQALQAQAARAGAFGGSRGALLEAEFERNLGQRLADIQTTGGAAAFDRATQRLEQERQRQIAGGQALAGLGAQEASVLSAGVGRQLSAGEAQRGLQTEAITRGLEEFQREVDYPKQQIGFYSGILRGYQPPMNTYQTVSTPFSPTQQILGQAAAAGAIGKGFGLFNDGGIVGLAFGGAPSQQYTESVGDDKGLSSMVGNPVASYANGGMTRIGSGPNFQVMSQDDLYSLAGSATPNDPNTSALIEEFQRRRLPVPPALGKSMTQSRATAGIGSAPPVIPAPAAVSENIRQDISGGLREGISSTVDKAVEGVSNLSDTAVGRALGLGNNPFNAELSADIDAAKNRQAAFEAEVERRQRDLSEGLTESREKAAELILGKGAGEVVGSGLPAFVAQGTVESRGAIAAAEQAQKAKVAKVIEDETKRLVESGVEPDVAEARAIEIANITASAQSEEERAAAVAKAVEEGTLQQLGAERSEQLRKEGVGKGKLGVGRVIPPSEGRPKTTEEEGPLLADDEVVGGFNRLPIEEAKPAAAAPAAEGESQEGQRDLTDWFGLAAAALAASTGREEGLTNAAKLLASTQRPEERLLNLTKAQYYGEAGKSDRLKAILKRQTDVEKLKLDYQKFTADILEKDRRFNLDSFKAYPDLYKQVLSIEPQAIAVLGDEDSTAEQKEAARSTIINSLKRAQSGLASGGSVPQDFAQYGVTGIRSI